MRWYWLLWLAATLLSFAAIETWALTTDHQRTLTASLRRVLGISPPNRRRKTFVPIFIGGLVALVAWLIPHLLA